MIVVNQINTISYIIIDMSMKHHNEQLTYINNALLCQICSTSDSDIYCCNHCYCFACQSCAKNHNCNKHNSLMQSRRELYKLQRKTTANISVVSRGIESKRVKAIDLPENRIQLGESLCKRCLTLWATKQCCQCKINYYCQNCFQAVHSNNKFNNHQFRLLKEEFSMEYRVKVSQPNKICKRLLFETNKQREERLNNLESNLSVVKDTLNLQYASSINENKQFLLSIESSFHQLIEDTKLKISQITARIKSCQQNNAKHFQSMSQSICEQLHKIINIRSITKPQCGYVLAGQLIQAKIQKSTAQIQQRLKDKPMVSYDKFGSEIREQIQEIKAKVRKIELKMIVQVDVSKASLNDSVCQSDKNTCNSNKNESKKLKKLLNLNSYKSTDRLAPLELFASPKRSNPTKTEHQFFIPNKSLVTQALSKTQLKEKEIDKCQTLNLRNSESNKQIKAQKDKKLTITNLMSPKTTKKINPNLENVSKSNLVKTGIKIEKTKKMINDIRSQMKEFTNRFTFQKQGSKTSIQGDNTQSLDVSRLSIESSLHQGYD